MQVSPTRLDYPCELEPIRLQILGALDSDPDEKSKIARCRYHSHCNSVYCPLCARRDGCGRKDQILEAAVKIQPTRLRFGTFTTKDVALDALRDAAKAILHAGRGALKALRVDGYAARLETSFEDWSESYHPHLHVIMDVPAGGRRFIPTHAWRDEWLRQLPGHLHPIENGAHCAPVRDVEASCYYLTKSPYFAHVDKGQAQVHRTVAAIRELKGVQRFATRGTMTSVP